ncbi:MAG: phosphoribosylanthranilate isomerase [Woeseiaceae bacterium]|nr:phosphoribosylanthranilate isomerase [Woeseiaceae bacterium]
MSVLIKICGMTDEEGVRAAVRAGADAVGFVFAESPRRVTPQHARAISKGVAPGVLRVAVMLHPDDDAWQEVLDVFEPDVLQTDARDFDNLSVPPRVRRWPVMREGDEVDTLPAEFLYEGRLSGRGETTDWDRAAELALRGRMILAGGLGAGNVAAAIARVHPFGVDVSSAVESAPGRKDPRKIREFIDAVRTAQSGMSES